MKKLFKRIVLSLAVLTLCFTSVFAASCNVSTFSVVGCVTSDTNSHLSMKYMKFNGKKEFSENWKEGTSVKVNVESKEGELKLTVFLTGEEPIYTGKFTKDSGITEFTLNVNKSGKYTIQAEAEDHSGSFSFDW